MKLTFPSTCSDNFFKGIPGIYARQLERKLAAIKRHGLHACLGTVFLRRAFASESPAQYVLILQDPEEETILIMLKWTVEDAEEVIIFLSILPERYNTPS